MRRICLRALQLSRDRFGTVIPAALVASLEAAPADEPSTLFLRSGLSKLDVLRDDLRALPGWRPAADAAPRASLSGRRLHAPDMRDRLAGSDARGYASAGSCAAPRSGSVAEPARSLITPQRTATVSLSDEALSPQALRARTRNEAMPLATFFSVSVVSAPRVPLTTRLLPPPGPDPISTM